MKSKDKGEILLDVALWLLVIWGILQLIESITIICKYCESDEFF